MWNDLSLPWREVFIEAWESYKSDTIPIGAVIVDKNQNIISTGRNNIYDCDSEHILAGTCLGHAEINALMKLKKNEHPNINDYTLYVGLEPCPMCFGAMVMVGIRQAIYAADDIVTGALEMKDNIEYIRNTQFTIKKASKEIEAFQITLQTSRGKFRPVDKTMEVWKRRCEKAVLMGELLHSERYFINAISSNKQISLIFDEVMNKYSKLFI